MYVLTVAVIKARLPNQAQFWIESDENRISVMYTGLVMDDDGTLHDALLDSNYDRTRSITRHFSDYDELETALQDFAVWAFSCIPPETPKSDKE